MPQGPKDSKVLKAFRNIPILVTLRVFVSLWLNHFYRLKNNFQKKIYPLSVFFLFTISFSGIFLSAHSQTHNLAYYLKIASSNSPLLKDYQNRIRSGEIDSLLITAANRPQVLAYGQVAIYPSINGFEYDNAITNGGNYSAVVSASQSLFNKGILKPQFKQVRIKNLTTINDMKISKLDLHKKITTQYLTAYADLLQLHSNEEVYRLLQRQQNILKQLVKHGIYKETDYLTFLTTLQSQEVTISQLQLKYKADLSMLNYLSGIKDTSMVTLMEPSLNIPYQAVYDSSIFFKPYHLDSLRIQNKKSLLDAQYKPHISWFADAGLNASKLKGIYRDFGTGFGINFSVPIYDGRQRDLKYQQFKIAEQTRQNYAAFFHKQYNQQIAMLMQQLRGTNKLVQKIKNKLKTLQLLVNVDKKLLNTGNLQITGYMLAIHNYLTIKSNLNQAQISRYQIINQLNYWNH